MNKYIFDEYERVNKRVARRLYNAGGNIYITPHKMRANSQYFTLTAKINKTRMEGRAFDRIVNEYEFYNCNNETGKYSAFYIKTGGEKNGI